MEIQRTIAIKAPPELIWDVITDLVSAKEWAPGFEDYPFISKEWPAKDSTAVWRYHAGPMKTDFKLTIVESSRGKALQIANKSRFGKGREMYRFSQSGDVTTVDYNTTSQMNLFGSMFAVFIKGRLNKQVDTTVANLKKRCEMLAQRKGL